nr:CidA/LrgA family protein [Neobacillus sp. Marseille-Q6967]
MIHKVWLYSSQLLLLIIIFHAGNLMTKFFHWKVPGNVIGMIILLGLLWLKIIKVDQIETTANWLLKHLGFFFIPISVGLMTLGAVIVKNGLLLLFILFISAFIGLITAGKTTQTVIKRKDVKVNAHHDR